VPPQIWFNYLDHDNRIRTRMTTDARGCVILFTLQLETLIDDHWLPVIRYDNAHGRAHIDHTNSSNPPESSCHPERSKEPVQAAAPERSVGIPGDGPHRTVAAPLLRNGL